MKLLSKIYILYNLFVSFMTLVTANSDDDLNINEVDSPSYYQYDAKPGQFPWVITFKTVHHCMGTLVHPSWVLTAAHCLEESSDPLYYILQLGYLDSKNAKDGQVQTVSELYSYPRYRISKTTRVRDYGNNIALMKTVEPFKLAPTLAMRQIPFVSDRHRRRPCMVLGFVNELSKPNENYKVLQFTRVFGYTFKDCYQTSRGQDNVKFMMRHTLCATGVEERGTQACSGDPGGPLVCPIKEVNWKNSTDFEVVGVSSWNVLGVFCGAMSRYTDVGYFSAWLNATMNGEPFVDTNELEERANLPDKELATCSTTRTCPDCYTIFFHLVALTLVLSMFLSTNG